MSTANPTDQHRLLAVQAHESRLRALSRQRAEVLDDAELASAKAPLTRAEAEGTVAQQARVEADAAVQALEEQGAGVRARIAKDEAALVAGNAGAGTLQGLQREIESLNAKASELEDTELEALDAAEAAAGAVETTVAAISAARAAVDAARAAVDARVSEIDAELLAERAARAEEAAQVEPGLLEVYERTLAKYGTGAARLFHGTSEGSGMALSPGDLAEIKRAPAEQVVFCPDSGVILVRDPEWA